jgi:hypothetical protein
MGRRKAWYCSICGDTPDWEDGNITRCRCVTFYCTGCGMECIFCGDVSCPECGDGINVDPTDEFVCDHCSSSCKTDLTCPDCEEELILIEEKYYCNNCGIFITPTPAPN